MSTTAPMHAPDQGTAAQSRGAPVAPPARTLPDLLTGAASRFARRPALLFQGRRWTYAALNAEVTRLAAGLQRLGIGPGHRVGLCLPNTPYSVFFFYAVLATGAEIVNYNPLYTTPELRKQIRDSTTATLVVPDLAVIFPKAAELLEEGALSRLIVCPLAGALPPLRAAAFTGFKRKLRAPIPRAPNIVPYATLVRGAPPFRPVAIDPQQTAVLQYTGGTTGLPKAALLSHANLAINALQVAAHMPSMREGTERLMAVLPFFHVFAMTAVLNCGIATGAELQLHMRFELEPALKAIARDKPTILHGVPTLYAAIANAAEQRGVDISSIRVCISGGAPLPDEVRARFERLTGGRLIEGYGLTEAGPVVSCNPPDGTVRPGSAGIPMAGTTIEIRDPANPSHILPQGERGEICVRGPQVMQGYLNRPEETAAVFIHGALRTGDIGYLDELGYLFVTDRIKDVIICGGYNVYPRVVEDALYLHPAVAEAVVVGVPDPYRGQSPLAFVTLKPGAEASSADLAAFLRTQLSPIEQPKRVEIRATLPKTAVGKLSRKELAAEFAKDQG